MAVFIWNEPMPWMADEIKQKKRLQYVLIPCIVATSATESNMYNIEWTEKHGNTGWHIQMDDGREMFIYDTNEDNPPTKEQILEAFAEAEESWRDRYYEELQDEMWQDETVH